MYRPFSPPFEFRLLFLPALLQPKASALHVVITRLTPTVVMHALSESVAIMVKHVMDHLYHKILNHSGHKSAQLFVKDDVNVTLAIIAILTGKPMLSRHSTDSETLV